jgi:predicted CXXCH cytochrome family protein
MQNHQKTIGDPNYTFHSGGVAECMGCHNIHDDQSSSAFLIADDISSTCTNASCHAIRQRQLLYSHPDLG